MQIVLLGVFYQSLLSPSFYRHCLKQFCPTAYIENACPCFLPLKTLYATKKGTEMLL